MRAAPDLEIPGSTVHFPVSGIRFPKWTAAAVVVFAAGLTAAVAHRLDALQVSPEVGIRVTADGHDPAPLPTFLGVDWIGRDVPVSAEERAILPPDTGFSRKHYTSVQDRTRQRDRDILDWLSKL